MATDVTEDNPTEDLEPKNISENNQDSDTNQDSNNKE